MPTYLEYVLQYKNWANIKFYVYQLEYVNKWIVITDVPAEPNQYYQAFWKRTLGYL